jgi:hypothetical protein
MRSTWNVKRQNWSQGRPIGTLALVLSIIAVFVLAWGMSGMAQNPVLSALTFDVSMQKPWTLITYPYGAVRGDLLWFFVGLFILYQFGSNLERETGPLGIVVIFFLATILMGAFYLLGTLLAGARPTAVPWLDLPDAFVFTVWAARNRSATVMFMFVIPIRAAWLGLIGAGFVAIQYGWVVPIVGVVTASSLGIAWLYGLGRIPGLPFGDIPDLTSKAEKKKDDREFQRFREDVRAREIEREEKERLRRLFESSLDDDEKKD